ncbi:MAG TPA: hypothetical protein VMF30_19055, partial [Pirellulales bacterium]|nr:hypothetical protein [Pirellulales bacterium]
VRHRRLHQQERGTNVDGHRAIEQLDRGVRKRAANDESRVVDQSVQTAEGSDRRRDDALGGGRIGEIVDYQRCSIAELGSQCFTTGAIAPMQDDARPLGDAAPGEGLADARGAAGDQNDFIR